MAHIYNLWLGQQYTTYIYSSRPTGDPRYPYTIYSLHWNGKKSNSARNTCSTISS